MELQFRPFQRVAVTFAPQSCCKVKETLEGRVLEHVVGLTEMLVLLLNSRQQSGSVPCVAGDWLGFDNLYQNTPPFFTRCLEGNLMVVKKKLRQASFLKPSEVLCCESCILLGPSHTQEGGFPSH